MSDPNEDLIAEGVRLASASDSNQLSQWARSNLNEFYELIARAALDDLDDHTASRR